MIYYSKCPACNAKKRKETHVFGVYVCAKCGAVYGTCTKGESYGFVLPRWETGEYDQSELRYYDFQVLGSDGVTRRHGWYLPRTKCIVIVG